MEVLLTQDAAAVYLGLAVRTVERYRATGTEHRSRRLGRRLIRHRKRGLEGWIKSSLRISSANELRSAKHGPESEALTDLRAAVVATRGTTTISAPGGRS